MLKAINICEWTIYSSNLQSLKKNLGKFWVQFSNTKAKVGVISLRICLFKISGFEEIVACVEESEQAEKVEAFEIWVKGQPTQAGKVTRFHLHSVNLSISPEKALQIRLVCIKLKVATEDRPHFTWASNKIISALIVIAPCNMLITNSGSSRYMVHVLAILWHINYGMIGGTNHRSKLAIQQNFNQIDGSKCMIEKHSRFTAAKFVIASFINQNK